MALPRRVTLAVTVLALFVATPALTAQQQDPDVTGDWSFTMEGPQGLVNMEVVFQQEDGELSGMLNGPMGSAELDGEIEGVDISFWISVDTPNGTFDLIFSGKVEENKKISGTMEAGGGEFSTSFTAERKETGTFGG